MPIKNFFYTVIITIILSVLALPEISQAIPAFARKYKISCTTCHTAFPQLKQYGEEFAGNGFIIKEKESERDYVTAGDELLWLNKDFPVAVRLDMFATHDQNARVENDLQIPWNIKLLSGGALYKNIGYYFYFFLYERGKVAGIEDAYIHFDNIFESGLDIMVGQFQTSDPLMKRELRLTYEDYEVYKTRVGDSRINLTYDRGVMLVYPLEKTNTEVFAMVVNGNGKDVPGNRKLDQDNYKNVALRVKQGFTDFLSIGGFYYYGKEKSPDLMPTGTNQVIYYGPDVVFGSRAIKLTAQYLYRKDTNPMFLQTAGDVKTHGYVAELIFAPEIDRSRYHFTGLYNFIDSKGYKYHTATLGYTYQLARNLRLLTEYTRDLENKSNRVVLGVVGAF